MNKTLLLILCDFLLLTLLSLVNWEKEEKENESSTEDPVQQSVSAMAMMEQDLLDTLASSLEEEKDFKESLLEETKKTQEELENTRQMLSEKESSLEVLQEDLQETEQKARSLNEEKQRLSEQVAQANESISQLDVRYEDLEVKAKQTAAQARILQEELDRKLAEIAEKEAALRREQEEKEAAKERIQELNVRVQVTEEQKRMLQENVEALKSDVEAERAERKELQAQTSQMAEGITELAERSQDLTKEFRSSIPINANILFDEFLDNRITTNFVTDRVYRGQSLVEQEDAMTIFVSDGQVTYALTHLSSTPLWFNKSTLGLREIKAQLQRKEARLVPGQLEFLALDPRIAATPISSEEVARLGGKVYFTALEPFKFSEAVLIDEKGDYYGEVEFRLDVDTPGYVRMKSKIFSRIVGEFSPSKGDLVLSKTGELLGIMVDGRYCLIVNHLVTEEKLGLGAEFSSDEFKRVFQSLKTRYDRLPSELR